MTAPPSTSRTVPVTYLLTCHHKPLREQRFDVRNECDARRMKLKTVLTVCCCGCGVAQLLCSEEKADGVANFVCFAAALHGTRFT